MKRIDVGRIAVGVGLGIFAVATWFAARPPEAPALPASTTATSSLSTPSSTPSSSQTLPLQQKTAGAKPLQAITISITSPASGAQWVIGSENTIAWDESAGVTGQMYLVSATSGAAVGWIQQNLAPGQNYFPWDTRELFLGETDPAGKDVTPGRYFIKMKFSSPSVPTVESAVFTIVASTTP